MLFPVETSLLDVPLGHGDGAGHVLMKKRLLVAEAAFQVDFCDRSMPQSVTMARLPLTFTVALLLFAYVHGVGPVMRTRVSPVTHTFSTHVRARSHAVWPRIVPEKVMTA